MRGRIKIDIRDFDDAMLLRDSSHRRRRSLPEGTVEEVTKGDMHGNAMLLIFTLIAEGALNVSREQFNELWRIYDKPVADLELDDLARFITILNGITANKDSCGLSFIGDMLADRGANDWFTLKVIEALDAKKVPFEIVFSNHDAGFVQYMNGRDVTHSPRTSLENLHKLLADRSSGVNVGDVKAIYNNVYLKHLKALSYRLDESQDPPIVLRTHAPVGLDTVKGVAAELGVAYDESTPKALAQSIDRINQNFTVRLKAADPVILDLLAQPAAGARPSHLFTLIWNRAGPSAKPEQRLAALRLEPEGAAYAIAVVHGHDGAYLPAESNRINIDSDLGSGADCETEQYVVHRARGADPAFRAEAKATEARVLDGPPVATALAAVSAAKKPCCCPGIQFWLRRRKAAKPPARSQVAPKP
ncbi:MAG: hypothetical protein P1U34_08455 [Coxiellaceae bacterium]|nr:hypothetical protein [Coxiellaceae bacterium]